jgi:hypothetical protein
VTRLWLDNVRPMPQGFDYHARSVPEAISCLMSGTVEHISFDHDLGDPVQDGHLLAKWIEQAAFYGNLGRLTWEIHSDNPVGSANIRQAMEHADQFWSWHEVETETEHEA